MSDSGGAPGARSAAVLSGAQQRLLDGLPEPWVVSGLGDGRAQVYVYGERKIKRLIVRADGHLIHVEEFTAGREDLRQRDRLLGQGDGSPRRSPPPGR